MFKKQNIERLATQGPSSTCTNTYVLFLFMKTLLGEDPAKRYFKCFASFFGCFGSWEKLSSTLKITN